MGFFEGFDTMTVLEKEYISKNEMQEVLNFVNTILDERVEFDITYIGAMEAMLVAVVEKAADMLPLDISDYEIIQRIDEWQEENGDDDNADLDHFMNVIFCNELVRKQIADAMKEGKAKELAVAIGITCKEN